MERGRLIRVPIILLAGIFPICAFLASLAVFSSNAFAFQDKLESCGDFPLLLQMKLGTTPQAPEQEPSLPPSGGSVLPQLRVNEVRVTQFDLTNFPTVRLFVSVLDYRGVPIKDLKIENFQLEENNSRVGEIRFAHEETRDLPLSILFIVDVSGSMTPSLKDEVDAVKSFAQNLREKDRVALLKFSDFVIVELEPTENKDLLIDALSHLWAFGQTRLYDAILQGINLMLNEGGARKAIIVLSDGLDNLSSESAISVMDFYKKEVLEKNKSFSIFTIGLGEQIDEMGLSAVADATGGKFFKSPTASELKALYNAILEQILSEYVIAYESGEKREGAIVEGKVSVEAGGGSAEDDFVFRSPGLGGALARIAWPGIVTAIILFLVLVILTFAKFMRAAWVTVMVAPREGKDFPLRGDVNLIGRGEDCQIRIRLDPSVLSHHAEIRLTKDGFVLLGLSEDSLPIVHGVPKKTAKLSDRDEFWIGNTKLIMHERRLPRSKTSLTLEALIEMEAEKEAGKGYAEMAPSGTAGEESRYAKPSYALVISGPHEALSFELRDRLTIGRKDADIILDKDLQVSRKHARVAVEAEEVFIEDLGSTNGTFVNGKRIEPAKRQKVSAGDTIQVGETLIRLS